MYMHHYDNKEYILIVANGYLFTHLFQVLTSVKVRARKGGAGGHTSNRGPAAAAAAGSPAVRNIRLPPSA